jgi:hypothetical protein
MNADPLTLAALGVAAIGIMVAFAGRWRPGLGEWARALVISGCAIGACAFAFPSGSTLSAFVAGFLVCAALHRWIDVFASRGAAEDAA